MSSIPTTSLVPRKSRHKRKGLPKTKSGCKTCRTRRVKCGEEKPSCLRCVKFGVSCDWNPIKGQENTRLAPKQPVLLPKNLDIAPSPKTRSPIPKRTVLLPRLNILAPLTANPSKSLFNDEEEHRYFETFSAKTAFEILPSFDSGTLRQILLEACASEPSIRHAVVALGALDKTADSLEAFGMSAGSSRDPVLHHQNALKQYMTAIKYMRAAASDAQQDLRTKLLTCLVIFCFEAWDGLKELAVQQIQTGLHLIQNWREVHVVRGRLLETPSKTPEVIEEDLVRAFSRLDVQAISFAFGPCRWPEHQEIAAKQERERLDQMPQVFNSIQEAEIFESAIIRRTMRFLSFEIPLPKLPHPLVKFPVNGWWGARSSSVLATQQNIMIDISRWEVSFEPLWKRLKAKGDANLLIAAMLRMHIKTALTALLQICIEDEMKFDDYQHVFAEIIDLGEYTLNVLDVPKSSTPKFQFDAHLVIPLHMVGHKCRDRILRRRAISLLLCHPRREGVWDSILGGRVAEWAMEIEEEHLENGKVPGWARIHGVALERDRHHPRRAILTCEQRLGPLSKRVVTRHKTIIW